MTHEKNAGLEECTENQKKLFDEMSGGSSCGILWYLLFFAMQLALFIWFLLGHRSRHRYNVGCRILVVLAPLQALFIVLHATVLIDWKNTTLQTLKVVFRKLIVYFVIGYAAGTYIMIFVYPWRLQGGWDGHFSKVVLEIMWVGIATVTWMTFATFTVVVCRKGLPRNSGFIDEGNYDIFTLETNEHCCV